MPKPTSRNLWTVKMRHIQYESLYVLAPTAEKASQKAIAFTRKHDGVAKPVVKEVVFSGTIDVF